MAGDLAFTHSVGVRVTWGAARPSVVNVLLSVRRHPDAICSALRPRVPRLPPQDDGAENWGHWKGVMFFVRDL